MVVIRTQVRWENTVQFVWKAVFGIDDDLMMDVDEENVDTSNVQPQPARQLPSFIFDANALAMGRVIEPEIDQGEEEALMEMYGDFWQIYLICCFFFEKVCTC